MNGQTNRQTERQEDRLTEKKMAIFINISIDRLKGKKKHTDRQTDGYNFMCDWQ